MFHFINGVTSRMNNPFNTRKPWLAALLTALLGPVIGMCYIGRGRLAVAYILVTIVLALLLFAAAYLGFAPVHPADAMRWLLIALQVGGVAHVFFEARRYDHTKPIEWYARWYVLVAFVLLPLLLPFAFRQMMYAPLRMPTASMSPNINQGDYLFAKSFAYKNTPPQRGDIVIFKVGADSFIQRIIGLPGDMVQVKNSVVYINGIALPRKTLDDSPLPENEAVKAPAYYTETLPEGISYTILDETNNAPLDYTTIYVVPDDYYFMLGDNRDQSQDSRDMAKIGFVHINNITGKAARILWHAKTGSLDFKRIQ
jgi:signal peptidase I